MKPQNVFVNYTHPNQQSDRSRRREVASYIGTYYRNRSRPAARRLHEDSQTRDAPQRELAGTDRASDTRSLQPRPQHMFTFQSEPPAISPLATRDGTGLRVDPFNSYPIRQTDRLPRAIDYCKHSSSRHCSNSVNSFCSF